MNSWLLVYTGTQDYDNSVMVRCFFVIFLANLDAPGNRSETAGKFRNVVLAKDGEDQLDQSCEKFRSDTVKHRGALRETDGLTSG